MTSISDKPRTNAEWRSIDIGAAIHQEVLDEGRREGVFAYLYHDGKGHAWFEKCARGGNPYRRFSSALAEKMKRHRDDLRIYARWKESTMEPRYLGRGTESGGYRHSHRAPPPVGRF